MNVKHFNKNTPVKVRFTQEQCNQINEAIDTISELGSGNVKDGEFQANIIAKLQYIARDRAIRSCGNDKGFNVSIHANKIKTETERSRIKLPVLDGYSRAFQAAGFESHVDIEQKSVEVFVPPVIDNNRTSFSLDDIDNQADVIREIRLREDLNNEE
ncbi:hypothetical protein FWP28_10095 [Vibrio alginolyticus]|nr:hypothetical protein [Vibrio alginolyticus]HCE2343432.1 hypothetical protein [Vibrio parahaemolyticus]HCE4652104.1 hypothetical protein [Vibrio parahaemolyticus]HCG9483760.1 hypothetical protein [Vibrio parahaemolyticus]HCH1634744.1 hypothetical protein [Vibrio parahaemolyticus]